MLLLLLRVGEELFSASASFTTATDSLMRATSSIKQPQYKDTLRQALMLIGTRASRAYLGGSLLRKALGAPADNDVYDTGFLRSLSHVIEITWFYWSAGVRCDITETRVTCHDLPRIGDRMSERVAPSHVVVVSGSAGRMLPSSYSMAAPPDMPRAVSARYGGHPRSVMTSDKWNRTPGRIWAKASWGHTVRLHGVRLVIVGLTNDEFRLNNMRTARAVTVVGA